MATHEIIRRGLYQRVNGKLTLMKPGTKLTFSKDVGERMVKRGFAKAIGEEKPEPVKQPVAEKKADPEPEDAEAEPQPKPEKKKATRKRRSKK